MGKILGGGLPVGGFGGRAEIMDFLAPLGPVYQAGTLSGNPLAMAAGIATIGYLLENRDQVYPRLERTTAAMADGVAKMAGARFRGGEHVRYSKIRAVSPGDAAARGMAAAQSV